MLDQYLIHIMSQDPSKYGKKWTRSVLARKITVEKIKYLARMHGFKKFNVIDLYANRLSPEDLPVKHDIYIQDVTHYGKKK